MPTPPEFLLVSDAANQLGVAIQTVRNWIKAGKLPAKRHPVNQYRMILRADIEALARQIQAPPAPPRKRAKHT